MPGAPNISQLPFGIIPRKTKGPIVGATHSTPQNRLRGDSPKNASLKSTRNRKVLRPIKRHVASPWRAKVSRENDIGRGFNKLLVERGGNIFKFPKKSRFIVPLSRIEGQVVGLYLWVMVDLK